MLQEHSHLVIDSVALPASVAQDERAARARIAMCACPGGRRFQAPDYDPSRDLARDLNDIQHSGARVLVSLIEDEEIGFLGLYELPHLVAQHDLIWTHLPIRDMGVPDKRFEARWLEEGERIRSMLRGGETVVLHCLAGLGRTGTIAARLLVEFGMEPEAAIVRVRDARPGAIQTRKQELHVLRSKPIT
ncbi:MAG: cyclin-dependent kinase inhibitor 3 family protein [Gammaproteobacteria bacterium]|nr:cyclin-dependent kinase inhibitor 3 family protein [Gammaproteobacteria bacterium]